jgi:hypothetical protein
MADKICGLNKYSHPIFYLHDSSIEEKEIDKVICLKSVNDNSKGFKDNTAVNRLAN